MTNQCKADNSLADNYLVLSVPSDPTPSPLNALLSSTFDCITRSMKNNSSSETTSVKEFSSDHNLALLKIDIYTNLAEIVKNLRTCRSYLTPR
ncbi:hypothetical protein AVEN_20932-1 [Araneus ventricosus]|uniref:Endonuclease/exonuclease/phosphatase domain-containing protein n=1 Tax=Araneus ventricosus TaxID=182803 RepID=A0A4Y2KN08_ARAVE|nr:hypothetical protein AVEN_20932-1 [Araneus ventricosus]